MLGSKDYCSRILAPYLLGIHTQFARLDLLKDRNCMYRHHYYQHNGCGQHMFDTRQYHCTLDMAPRIPCIRLHLDRIYRHIP
jgi:hypothetical protein